MNTPGLRRFVSTLFGVSANIGVVVILLQYVVSGARLPGEATGMPLDTLLYPISILPGPGSPGDNTF